MKHGIRHNVTWLLTSLHTATGSEYIELLKNIIKSKEFKPVPGEQNIFAMPSSTERKEYNNLLEAARKAAKKGNYVYIMPNPKGISTMDFIFMKKGFAKAYDCKTISGSNSVGNRLLESMAQTNRVILNMRTEYSFRPLAKEIRHFFEHNPQAVEVLIYRGNEEISISRRNAPNIEKILLKKWYKQK